jgi:hypothetical protein
MRSELLGKRGWLIEAMVSPNVGACFGILEFLFDKSSYGFLLL